MMQLLWVLVQLVRVMLQWLLVWKLVLQNKMALRLVIKQQEQPKTLLQLVKKQNQPVIWLRLLVHKLKRVVGNLLLWDLSQNPLMMQLLP